jgi:Transposase, Mutator family/Phage integrase family
VATGVCGDGRREVLGFAVGDSEDGAFWTALLRSLKARGLAEVQQLVIADAHLGPRQAVAAVMAGRPSSAAGSTSSATCCPGPQGSAEGEVAGLRWPDIDLEARRVSPRSPRVVVNHQVLVCEPKTAKDHRSIALDPATVAALREHRRWQLEERLAVGPGWEDSGLVFTWPDGRPLHPERFSKWFEQHTRAAGLPKIRLHDVRHSYATAALAAGIPARIVSERLGHANIAITHGHLQSRAARPGRARGRHRGPAHPRHTTPST